jgi:hypothetical protein
MSKNRHDTPVMPPPRDTFGNVDVRQVRKVDGRTTRPRKETEQFNTYVRPGLRDEIAALQRQIEAELGEDMTRGEFLEKMFDAFADARQSSGQSIGKSSSMKLASKKKVASPCPRDLAADRTVPVAIWATSAVAEEMLKTVNAWQWTLGELVEHNIAKAVQVVDLEKQLAALKAETRQ